LCESQETESSENLDVNDLKVREVALFAAKEMSSGRIKYDLDELYEAKKIIGSNIIYEMRVVLSYSSKCNNNKGTNGCKVSLYKSILFLLIFNFNYFY
jgi:hypothetical protein